MSFVNCFSDYPLPDCRSWSLHSNHCNALAYHLQVSGRYYGLHFLSKVVYHKFLSLLFKVSSGSFNVITFSVIPLLVSLFVRFIFVRLLKLTLSTFFWWSVVVLLRFTRLLLSRWVLSIFWICFLRLIGDRAMRTICWFCAQLNCVFNHGCDVLFIIFFRFGACKSLRFTTKRNTCLSFNFLQILYLIIGFIASFVELFGTFDMRCFCSLFLLTSLKLLFLRLFLLFNHLVVCFGLFVGIFHEDAL